MVSMAMTLKKFLHSKNESLWHFFTLSLKQNGAQTRCYLVHMEHIRQNLIFCCKDISQTALTSQDKKILILMQKKGFNYKFSMQLAKLANKDQSWMRIKKEEGCFDFDKQNDIGLFFFQEGIGIVICFVFHQVLM